GAEFLDRVDLHDDHAVEVGRRVEVQVLVRRTGIAVGACMAASPVRVDRVAEGDGGAVGDLVDDRAGAHVEELEAAELPGADLALGHVEQRLLRRVLGQTPAQLGRRHRRRPYRTCVRRRNWCDNAVMPPLPEDDVRAGLAQLRGWERRDNEIEKVYELASFPDAIAFVTRVGFLAEKANHHPDLEVRWRKVRVALSTHSEGGITDKDFALAHEIETVAGGGSSS